ncbi:MAG: hypothetical protein ACTS7D_01120 [Candidatus Hodgkinia cicadicola]
MKCKLGKVLKNIIETLIAARRFGGRNDEVKQNLSGCAEPNQWTECASKFEERN